jgi:hypothetical protein
MSGLRRSKFLDRVLTGVVGIVKLKRCAFNRGRGKTKVSHQVSDTKLMVRFPSDFANEDVCLRFGTEVEHTNPLGCRIRFADTRCVFVGRGGVGATVASTDA